MVGVRAKHQAVPQGSPLGRIVTQCMLKSHLERSLCMRKLKRDSMFGDVTRWVEFPKLNVLIPGADDLVLQSVDDVRLTHIDSRLEFYSWPDSHRLGHVRHGALLDIGWLQFHGVVAALGEAFVHLTVRMYPLPMGHDQNVVRFPLRSLVLNF